MSDRSFFVGYLPLPKPMRGFYLAVIALVVAVFGTAGFLLGAGQDAPEPAGFRFDLGRQTLTGVVEMLPYPVFHVTEGSPDIPAGRSILLSGQGKRGIDADLAPMAGGLALISGVALDRGTIRMVQLRGGANGLSAVEGPAPEIPIEPLGRWRVTGEICDGKCLSGAMRPGRGLAHKACANLCLLGGVPPVFVSTQPIAGTDFLLVTGLDGTALPEAAYDRIGQYVTFEGDVTRHGEMVVVAMQAETLELAE